jgi:hypothetical protein
MHSSGRRILGGMALVLLPLLLCAGTSDAAVITFDSESPGAYPGGTESGFTIVATNASAWAATWGFPTISVGAGAPNVTASFTFTTTGLFEFGSLDLVLPIPSGVPGPVTVQGYLGAALLAQDSFAAPGTANTPTGYAAVNLSGIPIDSLVVSTTSNATQTLLIDNITVTAVPEPSSFLLLGVGSLALGAWMRRRRRTT